MKTELLPELKTLNNSLLRIWTAIHPLRPWVYLDRRQELVLKKEALPLYQQAVKLHKYWNDEDLASVCAKIIVFDRLPRCFFRGTKEMFATDKLALVASKRALNGDLDKELPEAKKILLYLPLLSSEKLADQKLSFKLCSETGDEKLIQEAKERLAIIKEFSRFPHRNLILGRKSTSAEWLFLRTNAGCVYF